MAPRTLILFALALAACSFDDKHEKYPDPADPNRPVVQSVDRDPTASKAHDVPGYVDAGPTSAIDFGPGGLEFGHGAGAAASGTSNGPLAAPATTGTTPANGGTKEAPLDASAGKGAGPKGAGPGGAAPKGSGPAAGSGSSEGSGK